MLPTELLMFRVKAGLVQPKRLNPTPGSIRPPVSKVAQSLASRWARPRTMR